MCILIKAHSFYCVIFFKVQYKPQNETLYASSSIINYRDFSHMPQYYMYLSVYLSVDYTILVLYLDCLNKIVHAIILQSRTPLTHFPFGYFRYTKKKIWWSLLTVFT